MYEPGAQNGQQLQALIEKIQEKRKELEQQQKDLELTLIDLNTAEQRCRDSLKSAG